MARILHFINIRNHLTGKGTAVLALQVCVGLVLAAVGIYGLMLAFAGVWYQLAQAWGSFSLWFWDLAHGFIKVPPATFRSDLINAELTWMISSIFPLMLLGVGIWLCRESLTAWRKIVAAASRLP
jgi:hypothetical protein